MVSVCEVRLDPQILASMLQGYFQYVDLNVYIRLKTGLPRRLYVYLAKHQQGKTRYRIRVRKLAGLIPLKTNNITETKRTLTRAAENFEECSVVSSFSIDKGIICFRFGRKQLPRLEDAAPGPETQVTWFYARIGQEHISGQKLRAGVRILEELRGEGYTAEDIDYAVSWIIRYQERLSKQLGGPVYSIGFVREVIGQALAERAELTARA